MTLYHCKDSRSLRPLWALEEMAMDYQLIELPFPPRVFQKDYLGINPLGTVPYFIDGDSRMTESSGICHYLVERYRQLQFGLPAEHPEYASYINWLFYSDATITFPQTIMIRYTLLEPDERKLTQAVIDYRGFFLGRLRLLDAHMQARDYLVDDRFTVADICVGYALYLGEQLNMAKHYSPQLRGYLERLQARPAFIKAVDLGDAEPGMRELKHAFD
jgi:glutathione S-transferase